MNFIQTQPLSFFLIKHLWLDGMLELSDVTLNPIQSLDRNNYPFWVLVPQWIKISVMFTFSIQLDAKVRNKARIYNWQFESRV